MARKLGSGRLTPRGTAEAWFEDLLSSATQLGRAEAWGLTAIGILITAIADYLSGTDLWFGPFYLIVICFHSWVLGARAGILVGFGCMAAGLLVNGATVYPFGTVEIAWNVAVRVVAMILVIVLVAGFRRSYDREWLSARTDHLTGALTKRGFLERAESLRPEDRYGVLAYVDLDLFKSINDRHGHAAGDEMLRRFASKVADRLRAGDLFARIGGDEFLIYLRAADEQEACRAVAALHQRLNEAPGSSDSDVGCSIGALVLPAGANVGDLEIAAADRLMYAAKLRGRGLEIGCPESRQPVSITPPEIFPAKLAG